MREIMGSPFWLMKNRAEIMVPAAFGAQRRFRWAHSRASAATPSDTEELAAHNSAGRKTRPRPGCLSPKKSYGSYQTIKWVRYITKVGQYHQHRI